MSDYHCPECERDWMHCPDCDGTGGEWPDLCDRCDGAGEVLRDE